MPSHWECGKPETGKTASAATQNVLHQQVTEHFSIKMLQLGIPTPLWQLKGLIKPELRGCRRIGTIGKI